MDIFKKLLKFFSSGGETSVPTHHKAQITIEKATVHVLEMEDVLFHSNSCVMMPETPKGQSSGDGSGANAKQKKATGLHALALVFKQYQVKPDTKMLVCGHTDSSGGIPENYELSALRAKDVLYLLMGKCEEWAKTSVQKQKIEDHQQILQWAADSYGWDTSPGNIDNKWNSKTESALTNLFTMYNYSFAYKPPDLQNLDETLLETIKADGKKLWPIELWKAVFHIYQAELSHAVCGSKVPDASFKKTRSSFSFIDTNVRFVACGESFPVGGKYKDNYRSQKNRRVEILFFEKDNIPKLDCPKTTSKVHSESECPLRDPDFLNFVYIKPEDFFTAEYHIKLEYFDKIHNKVKQIPAGLQFKAWKGGTKEITGVRTKYANGIYELSLPGITQSPRESDIHFTFETKNNWVFTRDDKTEPQMLPNKQMPYPITKDDLKKENIIDQIKYYDLPEKWDSRNWHCKAGSNDGDFAKMNKTITTPKEPIVFNLDMIVLEDGKGSQDVSDKNGNDGRLALSADSRYSLLYINNEKLELYNPENAKAPYFTKQQFAKNVIPDTPGNAVAVFFANDVYSVGMIRSGQDDNKWDALKHIRGCRAATLKDTDSHFGEDIDSNNAPGHFRYFANGCGNFELHYFHRGCLLKNSGFIKFRSFLVIYWSARFKSNTSNPVGANKVTTFAIEGMKNAFDRWMSKGYFINPRDPQTGLHISPFFLFETKRDGRGGKQKCLVTVSSDSNTGWMGHHTSDMYSEDYKIRDYLGDGKLTDFDEKEYECLVVSHELGHATGKDDEYAYGSGDIDKNARTATDGPFTQYYLGMPYRLDEGSMMKDNRAPRMKQLWYLVNWINESSKNAKKLKGFLKGNQFQVAHTFSKDGKKTSLFYFLEETPNDYRDFCKPFKSERNAATGTGGIDLGLYKLGDDEATRLTEINNKQTTYDLTGVIVLYVKIGFKFNGSWTNAEKKIYKENTYKKLVVLDKKFILNDSAGKSDFKKTYVSIFPVCLDSPFKGESGSENVNIDGFSNYNITVDKAENKNVKSKSGKNLHVGHKVNKNWLANYILGKVNPTTSAGMKSSLDKSNLDFVCDWIKKKTGCSTFQLIDG